MGRIEGILNYPRTVPRDLRAVRDVRAPTRLLPRRLRGTRSCLEAEEASLVVRDLEPILDVTSVGFRKR